MDIVEILRELGADFPREYFASLIEFINTSLSKDIENIDQVELEHISNLVLGPSPSINNLITIREGEAYYLGKYQTVSTYEEFELQTRETNVPDYQCKRVKKDNRYYILEIISDSLLLDRDFHSFEEWHDYLNRLNTSGIISLEECERYQERVIVVYGIPDNYIALNVSLSETHTKFAEPMFSFNLLDNINRVCEGTLRTDYRSGRKRTFSFVTAHSHFLLVDRNFNVKLVALGASLVSRPKFASSSRHSQRVMAQGLGFSSYSCFIGMLLFEMLTDQCPIDLSGEYKNDSVKFLSNSGLLNGYPRHVRAFIKRATHNREDYRYSSLERLQEDIQHICEYMTYRVKHQLNEIDSIVVEFLDYLRLRIKAHKLNPRLGKLSLEESGRWFIRSMATDFNAFFQQSEQLAHIHKTLSDSHVFKQKLKGYSNASPTSLYFYEYYLCFKCILKCWNQRPDAETTPEVEFIGISFLVMIIEYELIAFAQALARTVLHTAHLTDNERILPEILPGYKVLLPEPENQRINFPLEALKRLRIMLNSQKVENNIPLHIEEDLELYDTIAAFVLWVKKALVIENEYRNTIYSNTGDRDTRNVTEYITLAQMILSYSTRLNTMYPKSFQNPEPIHYLSAEGLAADEWEKYTDEFVNLLWRLLPAKRTKVHLSYTFRFIPEKIGEVQYRTRFLFHKRQKVNQDDLIHLTDLERTIVDPIPVKVDFLHGSPNRVGSVLVNTSLGFPRLGIELKPRVINYRKYLLWIKHTFARVPRSIFLFVISLPILGFIGILVALWQVKPIAKFEAIPQSGKAPLLVQFTDHSDNAHRYLWQFAGLEESNSINPKFEFKEPGTYNVTLTVYSDFSPNELITDLLGFKDEYEVSIEVLPP